MKFKTKLRKLHEQVIVITGGTSGIGLATARMAADSGATVVLVGRNRRKLRRAVRDICASGGKAAGAAADVADFSAVEKARDFTLDRFGRFDTWINNAGIHIFGSIESTPERDARRLFDVDYWGVVHGSRAAVPFLKERGGALINIGSVLSSRSVPLQGYYGAAKHAVQGYTDALRGELESEGAPVSVTLIKPSSIGTPIPRHSKNLMEERARLPFPLYDPRVAASGILFCAETPRRDLVIGGVGKLAVVGEKFFPFITDEGMKLILYRMQKTRGPRREEDTLHSPQGNEPRERGEQDPYVARSSAYTWAKKHPVAREAATGAALAAVRWLKP